MYMCVCVCVCVCALFFITFISHLSQVNAMLGNNTVPLCVYVELGRGRGHSSSLKHHSVCSHVCKLSSDNLAFKFCPFAVV